MSAANDSEINPTAVSRPNFPFAVETRAARSGEETVGGTDEVNRKGG